MLHAMSLNLPTLPTASNARLLRTLSTFSHSLMVSDGLLALGTTSIHFAKPGWCQSQRLLLSGSLSDAKTSARYSSRQLSEFNMFQQDSAPP